jgi:hypothetical protein
VAAAELVRLGVIRDRYVAVGRPEMRAHAVGLVADNEVNVVDTGVD